MCCFACPSPQRQDLSNFEINISYNEHGIQDLTLVCVISEGAQEDSVRWFAVRTFLRVAQEDGVRRRAVISLRGAQEDSVGFATTFVLSRT